MPEDYEANEQFEATVMAIKREFDREDYDLALPLCMKALDMQPESSIVRRCRIFALLSLSRWADALQACERGAGAEESVAFERAYCFYRLNRFQEALDALKTAKADDDDDRLVRLEAQVRYRMGDYEACATMYEKLHEDDPEDIGLLVNAAASRVSGERPREALRLLAERDELLEGSYELCFNQSCALIDEGRLVDADAQLENAKQICISELLAAEELADEDAALLDDHEELAAIHVQRACVLQRRGLNDEAGDLYGRVLKQRVGQQREVDVTVLAVACNNVVALRSEGKSLFDSLKRINVASKESLEHKLTRKQTIEIAINKCLLLVQAHKIQEAKTELQRLQETFPGHPRVAIVQAAIAHSSEKKNTKACEDVLTSYLAEHPANEEVLLSLAQLRSQQRDLDGAVEVLVQLPVARRAQPRTVEAIVALHQKQRNPEKAVASLREAIDYWTKQGEAEEETLAAILRIAARLALQLKDSVFAAEVYQLYLEKIDGTDVQALCGLVQALAGTDVDRALQYALRLKVPDYDHLDPEEMENQAIPKVGAAFGKKREKDAAAAAAAAAAAEDAAADKTDGAEGAPATKAKRKRTRKVRYPKGFDPENTGPMPDPERWLPKHERAEYKKKMRKRDKNLLRGPQGSMPTDDNAFRKGGPSTAQVEVSKDNVKRNQGRKAKKK